MQDRFKFRAWDNEKNKYIYDAEYTYDNPHGDCFSDLIEGTYGSFTVEQCTGLKDKNGRLIYEGDIVRQISKREPEYEEYITEVKWSVFGYPLYDEESFDFEVIGNIHTNPELVEK